METGLFILVSSDPRSSTRAAEALRIAAGLAVWKKISLALYLRGPALLMLTETDEPCQGEEDWPKHFTLLQEADVQIFVEAGFDPEKKMNRLNQPFRLHPVETSELPALLARARYVANF
jgi:sulfur relay (sulfurtransferase) DsrF/TusC family protein